MYHLQNWQNNIFLKCSLSLISHMKATTYWQTHHENVTIDHFFFSTFSSRLTRKQARDTRCGALITVIMQINCHFSFETNQKPTIYLLWYVWYCFGRYGVVLHHFAHVKYSISTCFFHITLSRKLAVYFALFKPININCVWQQCCRWI